ncbi:uncharacterized protein LOC125228090 [Leguminivora glycinivorella]|uniref:uncharacterized protein LOC125228090 n=1 Tax=Leguminivora glycinivorella TaxID=1035111 RepID=UPI00200F9329|nr:uncharacterized protein LOC125228090 [Leguminivora glycinivorella]
MMLFSSTIYYILLLYKFVHGLVQTGESMQVNVQTLIILLMNYVMVLALIVASGQRVRNQAEKLDATLALITTTIASSTDGAARSCLRSARALMRRLRAAPLRVRLVARPVQASLLATVLVVTTDYTIILLQFNHVV